MAQSAGADIAGYIAPASPGLFLFDLVLAPRVNTPFPKCYTGGAAGKNPQASVNCGSWGAVTLASLLATPAYTVVAGPLMSQWVFRYRRERSPLASLF